MWSEGLLSDFKVGIFSLVLSSVTDAEIEDGPEEVKKAYRHIAMATVAGVDILVSWNFHHVVHFDKIRQFNAVNLEKGYRTISIHSPREVTTHASESG